MTYLQNTDEAYLINENEELVLDDAESKEQKERLDIHQDDPRVMETLDNGEW